jgi:hypothetical protein
MLLCYPRESAPPAHAGLTYRDLVVVARYKIPAFAGMTEGERGNDGGGARE